MFGMIRLTATCLNLNVNSRSLNTQVTSFTTERECIFKFLQRMRPCLPCLLTSFVHTTEIMMSLWSSSGHAEAWNWPSTVSWFRPWSGTSSTAWASTSCVCRQRQLAGVGPGTGAARKALLHEFAQSSGFSSTAFNHWWVYSIGSLWLKHQVNNFTELNTWPLGFKHSWTIKYTRELCFMAKPQGQPWARNHRGYHFRSGGSPWWGPTTSSSPPLQDLDPRVCPCLWW